MAIHSRPHGRTLRAQLARLLAAVLLPLVIAAGALLVQQWRSARGAAFSALEDHARTLRRAVDRELALDQGVLRALSTSRDFDAGNWAAVHRAASQAAEVRPGSWIVVYDATGQNLVNTSVPFGAPLPNFEDLLSGGPREAEWRGRKLPLPGAFLMAPFATGQPSFSGVFFGPVNLRPVVASTVPVLRRGKPRYVVALAYGSEFFVHLLQAEQASEGLVTAVFDQAGLFVARNDSPDAFVARRGPAPFSDGTAGLPTQGVGEGLSAESVPFVFAYSRSAVNGWIVAAGKPRADVLAPARRALWMWLAVLVSAGSIGALMATRLWRQIAVPLDALVRQAQALGDPHPDVPATGVREVEAMRAALVEAARNEQARRELEREREEARRRLHEANDRLRDADRRKDEFLSMLSHELRNPLAPIRNSIHVLRHVDPASARASRAREVIERQTQHLTRLVDDLLDVTRVARGKVLLQPARVDLRDLVSRATEDARAVAEPRGVGLHVELPPRTLWANADATRVTQIVGNLLSNALKFTRPGDVITVMLREVSGVGEIVVRDTGAGIEPDLLPSLFDAFVQGPRTLARSEGGLGLGLALVKGLAALHGGSVRAHSEGVGRGAEFAVMLPLAGAGGDEGDDAAKPARAVDGDRALSG